MKNTTLPLIVGLICLPQAIQAQAQQPNILLIMADDLRPELGCYGANHIHSPNIDRMAAEGVTFSNAYCNIPVSGASRASLLTGLYPIAGQRFVSYDSSADRDAPQAIPISAWFRQHGYHALSNGKVFHNLADHYQSWSETPWRLNPEGYGKDWADYNKWELWLNDSSAMHTNPSTGRGPYYESAERADPEYDDGQVALRTVEDLRRMKQSGKPFFMAVGFWRPHLPFNAPKRYWDLYNRDSIRIADNRYRPHNLPSQVSGSQEIFSYGLTDSIDHRTARHGYYACVSFIDAQIGIILDELRSLGLDSNTVVVLVGDHGWHLGEHNFWGKHNLMNRATRSPLIVKIPGAGANGRKTDEVAEFVDIYPTLCQAAGIPTPEELQGESLTGVIANTNLKKKRFATIIWGEGVNIVDKSYSYSQWLSKDGSIKSEMLFDHNADSEENKNIIQEHPNNSLTEYYRKIARTLQNYF